MIRHRPPGTLLPPFPSTPLQIHAVTLIQTHREGMTKRPHLLLPSPGFPHFSHSRLTTPLLPYHVFLFSWSYIFSVDDNVSSSPTFLLFPLSFFFFQLAFSLSPTSSLYTYSQPLSRKIFFVYCNFSFLFVLSFTSPSFSFLSCLRFLSSLHFFFLMQHVSSLTSPFLLFYSSLSPPEVTFVSVSSKFHHPLFHFTLFSPSLPPYYIFYTDWINSSPALPFSLIGSGEHDLSMYVSLWRPLKENYIISSNHLPIWPRAIHIIVQQFADNVRYYMHRTTVCNILQVRALSFKNILSSHQSPTSFSNRTELTTLPFLIHLCFHGHLLLSCLPSPLLFLSVSCI